MKSEIQKRPYKRKYKCHNCKGLTDAPAYHLGKIYCQKCTVVRRVSRNKQFPTKEYIKQMKELGRWKE